LVLPSDATAAAVSQRLAKVPPFPPVAARLLRLLSDDSVDMKEVARTIACDPTFSARVLQHANSAEFALIQSVTNLRQALTMIGLDRTRALVTTLAAAVYSGSALRATELRRCWQHAVATGVLAGFIARACGSFTDTAYTAGIMHDIGRLGLLVAYPREYENTLRYAAERCLDLLDYEREIFGLNHAEAGRWLADRWQLPEEYRIIAGRHHDPCEGTENSLLRVVHVACRLADAFGYDVTCPLIPQPIEVILEDLPERARARLLQQVDEMRAQLDDSLHRFDRADVMERPPVRREDSPGEDPFFIELPSPPPAAPSTSIWRAILARLMRFFCAIEDALGISPPAQAEISQRSREGPE
jgi:HD-like signal output (HDOD) protein